MSNPDAKREIGKRLYVNMFKGFGKVVSPELMYSTMLDLTELKRKWDYPDDDVYNEI